MRLLFVYSLVVSILLVVSLTTAVNVDTLWQRTTKANPEDVINFHVALNQRNLDILESTLLDVSDPTSLNYGKHWTISSILDLVAPLEIVSNKIVEYLENNGCVNVINNRDAIKASATVEVVERLFWTEMHYYQHQTIGNHQIIRSSIGHLIPDQFIDDIHLIAGLSELPFIKDNTNGHGLLPSSPLSAGLDPGIIIPETIQNLYNVPSSGIPSTTNNQSSICLVEFARFSGDLSYNSGDLTSFASQTAVPPINVTKVLGHFNGNYPQLKPTLDVQYGGAISQSSDIWYWTNGEWLLEFSNELFIQDPAPFVVTLPWGFPEIDQCQPDLGYCNGTTTPAQFVQRINIEFMKIGLRGITLIAGSGDEGAPGSYNDDCLDQKYTMSSYYPGSSPYVTSVGSTMLLSSNNQGQLTNTAPICSQYACATSTLEVVQTFPNTTTTSGGGFSDYSPMPSWQQSVVEHYLNSGIHLPPQSKFNESNRGYPDVSVVGHNYMIYLNGPTFVDGTTCATPTFAGMVALLNSYRLSMNKSTLGFLNPLLYSAPSSCFNDITIGNNKCTQVCCTTDAGYTATAGWDPVSGLGTPRFKNLLAYIDTLP
ncbi:hypothetical protein SAMD00019534_057050 [Acytostelium subglobosum LB1]|uniref:hypothetical protein n=1 Tax=Acytostelium subglobosum LB1 TaxID=1410327 RepID=UPI000644D87C|nr:hypothetical protein SAMD00019534_057050 [Acytostelium subglobosum LB1]GAM22530.1 hypothetical protein SAMD00019534_057050 [Acytostelium subglobosum LB1]|eukprot:XP_012754650.1 hypothetical protein SAMD00019534_057050 [Acytostelium subglobosum LB1]